MALTLFGTSATKGGDLALFDGRKAFVGVVQGDSSYPTGGYPVDPTLFGMAMIDQIYGGSVSGSFMISFAPAAAAGPLGSSPNTTGPVDKVKVINYTTDAEIANATSLAGVIFELLVIGI